MKTINFVELKNKDIKILKQKLYTQNNGICPLLKIPIPFDKMALDHIHKLNSEPYATNKGTIRNAIEFRANTLEGTISNKFKRLYGADVSKHPISLPDFLRNLANYLEEGAYCETSVETMTYMIHPTEVPKAKKVKKSSFNKMLKMHKQKYPKKKPPVYPKSKKLTKLLKKLFLEFNITSFYYSN